MKCAIVILLGSFCCSYTLADSTPPATQPSAWVWDSALSTDFAIEADMCTGVPAKGQVLQVTTVHHLAPTTQPATESASAKQPPATQPAIQPEAAAEAPATR